MSGLMDFLPFVLISVSPVLFHGKRDSLDTKKTLFYAVCTLSVPVPEVGGNTSPDFRLTGAVC